MRSIIVGAGEVGKQMAKVLCYRKNDVVVVDLDANILEYLQDQLDIMTILGNGAAGRTLIQAGADKADLLLAVTNNSEANILSCNVAKHFNIPKKIARIRSNEYFDFPGAPKTEEFGVDYAIIPEYECAANILDGLLGFSIKETVKFDHPDAQLVNFQIRPGSPMVGCNLATFPRKDLIDVLRVCAILRYGKLIIPDGQSTFMAFDEIYAAGDQRKIEQLISWADQQSSFVSRVIIAGGTYLGSILASMLNAADIEVRFIEPDDQKAEHIADVVGTANLILQGESTEFSVLEEAGINHTDVFVATHEDDETNILSCIVAKKHGAKKVIAVTSNSDYLQIIAGMTVIDCCFSPLVSAINMLIKHIGTENRQTVAILKRTSAEILEMTVDIDSPIAHQQIKDISFPAKMVFAIVFRGGKLIPALGNVEIQPNDHIIVLTKPDSVPEVEKLFMAKRLFR